MQRGWSQKPNLPPSLPTIPIIGNLHQLGTLAHRSFRDLSQKYGLLILLHLGHVPALIVSSAEIAAEIMKTQDLVFANRPLTTAGKAILYGCAVVAFAPYGEYWRQVRKICVLDLLSINRVQSFKFLREEEVAIVIEKITRSCSMRETINLSSVTDGGFPSLGWMDVLTGLVAKLKKTSKDLDTFFDQVIDEHLLPKSHDDDQDDKKDFIELLLHAQKDNPNLTRDNIKARILDMFVSGSDTFGTTIKWTMAELIKNPRVMKKAQEEIRRVVGKKSTVDKEDIYQMDYLKSIVKESLRLHAPVPTLVPRESSKRTKLEGYDIPPNTRVFINAWAIHRDSKLWDNPEEFHPERFENNPIDFKGQDFGFIPFG
ncbi:Cytochrome P450 [Macleaya cordata]|uniref:Cytochrome P450 n=1 Tax=Macleaya cordata TaxID=56857 RepID=A0A200RCZ5_MACCD|nr:Cytochrome P450 [Macleaya cordata]